MKRAVCRTVTWVVVLVGTILLAYFFWRGQRLTVTSDDITVYKMYRIQDVVAQVVLHQPEMAGKGLQEILGWAENNHLLPPDSMKLLLVDGWKRPFVLLHELRSTGRRRWMLIAVGQGEGAVLGRIESKRVLVFEWEDVAE